MSYWTKSGKRRKVRLVPPPEPVVEVPQIDLQALAGSLWKVSPASMAAHLTRGNVPDLRWFYAKHLELLSARLVDVAMGRCPRLLVTMPPRFGKSELISIWFPIWLLENFPTRRVILCSYAADLAAKFGREARDRIGQYSNQLSVRISDTSASADSWDTTQHGGMKTAGVGGPITGFGANCLPAGTMIATEWGSIEISHLIRLQCRPRVLSFDHENDKSEWKNIVATKTSRTRKLFRVRTFGGREVWATGQHRLFCGQPGYKEANRLVCGDRLSALLFPEQQVLQDVRTAETRSWRALSDLLPESSQGHDGPEVLLVRKGIRASAIPAREGDTERPQGCLLLDRVQPSTPWSEEPSKMRDVREGDVAEDAEVLFQGVQAVSEDSSEETLPELRNNVFNPFESATILRAPMCKSRTFCTDDGFRQFPFQDRNQLRQDISGPATLGFGKRQSSLRDLCEGDATYDGARRASQNELSGTSSGRRSDEQRLEQLDYALHDLSCNSPQVEQDTICTVECVETDEYVYDIQVEDNENFFANGILVHNCLILDDLIKNAAEANSVTIRQNTWEWLQSTAMTRLQPGAGVVMVETRWHPDDPPGRLKMSMEKDDGEKWEIIDLPALAERDDPMGRNPGESLWPEMWPVDKLLEIKKGRGSWVWNALFQQKPMPPEGGYFKRDWLESVPSIPKDIRIVKEVRFWDLAGTVEGEKGNTDPDWTVGLLMCLTNVGTVYIKDVQRERQSPANVERLVQRMAKRDTASVCVRMQQDPGQAGKDQVHHYARHILSGYDFRGIPSNIDKVTRSGPFNAACERGDVKLVSGSWNGAFVEELCVFPNAPHDDQVDSASGAYAQLTAAGQAWDVDSMKLAFSYNASPKNLMAERIKQYAGAHRFAEN